MQRLNVICTDKTRQDQACMLCCIDCCTYLPSDARLASYLVSRDGLSGITAAGPMSMPEVSSIAVEILEGLTQLHAANIWYLDLKPGNILLDEFNHAYLSDFGISYALRTLESCTALTSTTGTPHYM